MITLALRAEPLPIAGVLARGDVARALARLLRARPESIARLSGVSFDDGIVLVGDPGAIPWVDGATWLGCEPSARSLHVPTHLAVTPHPALVLRALHARVGEGPIVLATSGDRLVTISLVSARTPGGAELEAWAS